MFTKNQNHMMYVVWMMLYEWWQIYQLLYDVWFLRYRVRQTEFFAILGHFLPFYHLPPPPPIIPKFKILKKEYVWWYYPFIHTCDNKWRSYGIQFPKYQVQKTNFCHFGPFFALSAPWQPRKSKFSNWKKHLEILSFYT